MTGDLLAQEDRLVLLAVGDRTEHVAHPPFAHHLARQLGGLLDVVLRSGAGFVVDQAFSRVAAHGDRDPVHQPSLAARIVVFLRQRERDAEGVPVRHHGHLVERVGVVEVVVQQRVAGLVVGGHLTFLGLHHLGAPRHPHHDLVAGILEVDHFHPLLVLARRQQGRFVDDVGQIGARHARRRARHPVQVHPRRDGDLPDMNAEDLLAPAHVRHVHHHLAVETARPQQRRIEHVGTVGGGDDDHALLGVEPVHLHQHLVEGLLTLVVAAAVARPARPPDGVEFVDEQNAGRVLASLLEQVTHPAGADTHEHLHEIRARHVEERRVGLAGDRLGKQGLAGPRHADQQHALGNARAYLGELAGVLQELDHLLQLVLRLVLAGDIGEVDLLAGLHETLGAALAERERAIAAALYLPEHEPDEDEAQHPGQEFDEHPQRRHAARSAGDLHRLVLQRAQQIGIGIGNVGLEVLAGAAPELPLDLVAVDDLDRFHHVLVDVVQKYRVRDLLRQRALVVDEEEDEKDDQDQQRDKGDAIVEVELREPGVGTFFLRVVVFSVTHIPSSGHRRCPPPCAAASGPTNRVAHLSPARHSPRRASLMAPTARGCGTPVP